MVQKPKTENTLEKYGQILILPTLVIDTWEKEILIGWMKTVIIIKYD